eukprot:8583732-Lingulodinium_polyedra.AAC.1
MVEVLLRTWCREVPQTPASNKWAKLGPCVDAVMLLSMWPWALWSSVRHSQQLCRTGPEA